MSLTVADRKAIPLEDFAWPEQRKFPVDTQDHLDSLATLIGTAPDAEQPKIKARAIAIAKRHGFTLPKSWQDAIKGKSEGTQESLLDRPLPKIATLQVCFLEYNARSLNGRIYPKETCDRIFMEAQAKLADSSRLPITCYINHAEANADNSVTLVGRVVRVWQSESKFYADIDLADTRAARDVLALASGGYLTSESMRVLGVELTYSEQFDVPIVIPQAGCEPELMGIDLTARPGLQDTARIMAVLYESDDDTHKPYIEQFTLNDVQIEALKGADPMPLPIYVKVLGGLQEALTADRKAHQVVHDHLAGVLDATVAAKHGSESARLISAVESELSEEGRAIAKENAVRIAKAHDASAESLGMECAGCYNDALGIELDPDTDGDGIPDEQDPADQPPQDGESQSHQEGNDMTKEEMLEALKKEGYSIEAPKSADQLLEERIAAAVEAKLATLTESNNGLPQRQTQVLNSAQETSTLVPEEVYEDGDYLKGTLHPKNWKALGNRRVAWPKDIDPKLALREMAPFLAHRLLSEEAHARGRDLHSLIGANEQI